MLILLPCLAAPLAGQEDLGSPGSGGEDLVLTIDEDHQSRMSQVNTPQVDR